jgi:CheY-like chemotaxis protein
MGGSLHLESSPGEGSCFRFVLELSPAEGSLPSGGKQADRFWHLVAPHRVRALVVDDVEDNREVLSGLLARAGVEVRMAINGAEALQKVAEQTPDIVFMDVRMPVMDGLAAVRQLRQRWPADGIVCVAITASGLLRQRSYYLDAGFDDFIGKPFVFERICECMERYLHVRFACEPPAEVAVTAGPCTINPTAVRLPDGLRKRLLDAARINALTEIETLIGELKASGPDMQGLADELECFLSRYDTDSIVALVDSIPGAEK